MASEEERGRRGIVRRVSGRASKQIVGTHKGDRAPRRWRKSIWESVEIHRLVSIVLVLAAPVIGFGLGHVGNPRLMAGLLVLQLVVAAATWLLGEGRAKRMQQEREDAALETRVAIGDVLDPALVGLSNLAAQNLAGRRTGRSGMLRLILAAASGLAPTESRARACYFKLTSDGSSMNHEASVGRAVEAKARFAAGTPEGDAALDMVRKGAHLYCDDVLEHPPPGWVPTERGEYRTFVSVAVRSADRAFGMLTLDSPEVGSLTLEDVQMLRVLGHILGVVERLSA